MNFSKDDIDDETVTTLFFRNLCVHSGKEIVRKLRRRKLSL